MNPRQQGDLGEASAIEWLTRWGAGVYFPLFHSPDIDLIAEKDGQLHRVQVKTCTCRYKERWYVSVSTKGGNQSWNGVVKKLDSSRCDYLFVLVADGRRWFIPAGSLGGGSAIHLGGPKYASFEVESGDPIRDRTATETGSRIDDPLCRGDARVAKGSTL
jgi:hypothetical protein